MSCKENKAIRRPVRKGVVRDDVVEILQGLSPGEQVVTAGQSSLKDGAPVRLTLKTARSRIYAMNLARFALRNPITILMAVLGRIILGHHLLFQDARGHVPGDHLPFHHRGHLLPGRQPSGYGADGHLSRRKSRLHRQRGEIRLLHLPPGSLPGHHLSSTGGPTSTAPSRMCSRRST